MFDQGDLHVNCIAVTWLPIGLSICIEVAENEFSLGGGVHPLSEWELHVLQQLGRQILSQECDRAEGGFHFFRRQSAEEIEGRFQWIHCNRAIIWKNDEAGRRDRGYSGLLAGQWTC